MVKGCNDKQSGFWMFLSQVVQPQILRCEGRRIGGEELKIKGSPMWTALSDEERQRWKDKAKAFNNSTAGRADQKKKREWFRERKSRLAQPLNASQQGHQSRMKQSLIMPPSGRVDEIDQQARVYFDPDSSDFIWKREHDVNELVGQYTWRFGQQSTAAKECYFLNKTMWIAAVNVYYQDGERMVPSEISLIKFRIGDGFDDQRNFILALPFNNLPPEHCKDNAVCNEERTAIRIDRRGNQLTEALRKDIENVWEEIKEFTDLDGGGQKILVCADQWNEVVGSFYTLHSAVHETAFSRVETRFVTMEDYFMAMAVTMLEVECDEEMKLCVSAEMREKWPGAIEFDRVTCPYHYQFRFRNECQTRSCSMFVAHQAVFNFFTLCQKYVFRQFAFTGNHLPNKAQLPQLASDDVECVASSQQVSESVSRTATGIVASQPLPYRVSGYAFVQPAEIREAPQVYRAQSEVGLMRQINEHSNEWRQSEPDLLQFLDEHLKSSSHKLEIDQVQVRSDGGSSASFLSGGRGTAGQQSFDHVTTRPSQSFGRSQQIECTGDGSEQSRSVSGPAVQQHQAYKFRKTQPLMSKSSRHNSLDYQSEHLVQMTSDSAARGCGGHEDQLGSKPHLMRFVERNDHVTRDRAEEEEISDCDKLANIDLGGFMPATENMSPVYGSHDFQRRRSNSRNRFPLTSGITQCSRRIGSGVAKTYSQQTCVDHITAAMNREWLEEEVEGVSGTANNISHGDRSMRPSSSAGMLTKAASALPINPSSWYVKTHERAIASVASGRGSTATVDEPLAAQLIDASAVQHPTFSKEPSSGHDAEPTPIRYRDASKMGWSDLNVLEGADEWISSLGGYIVRISVAKPYGHRSENTGFGPYNQ